MIAGDGPVEPATRDAAPRTIVASPRERLLLDFGWRFRLGHADDPSQDFGFGRGQMYSKVGAVFAPSRRDFDDSAWRPISLPHDWAVDLPFQKVDELIEFGAKPLGRAYPATSVGWYRRTFEIPAADARRRLSLEFDGVYRDCIAALNGHVMARNESGLPHSGSTSPTTCTSAARTCWWSASTRPVAMGGSTRARESTATCGS